MGARHCVFHQVAAQEHTEATLTSMNRTGSLEAGNPRIADEVLFQLRVEWTLAAQPGEGAFRFRAELHLRELRGAGGWEFGVRRIGFLYADLNEFRTWSDARIHAAGGNEFGLSRRISSENLEQGNEVGVGELVKLAAKETADVTSRNAALLGEVTLVEATTLALPLKGDGKVAHGASRTGVLGEGRRWKMRDEHSQWDGGDRKDE